ncbi:hypothetical protein BDN72DRAFT_864513 [Pluteus cervinus]|uniref:Uncharacterized protein n=1 Tax=Pluteus cervinus TaxID=181527 RepID=A0ACD3A3K7_9AGAR|nr:hypothetical protein BDN72DRAFT_864513 [Pluteus cervinus]
MRHPRNGRATPHCAVRLTIEATTRGAWHIYSTSLQVHATQLLKVDVATPNGSLAAIELQYVLRQRKRRNAYDTNPNGGVALPHQIPHALADHWPPPSIFATSAQASMTRHMDYDLRGRVGQKFEQREVQDVEKEARERPSRNHVTRIKRRVKAFYLRNVGNLTLSNGHRTSFGATDGSGHIDHKFDGKEQTPQSAFDRRLLCCLSASMWGCFVFRQTESQRDIRRVIPVAMCHKRKVRREEGEDYTGKYCCVHSMVARVCKVAATVQMYQATTELGSALLLFELQHMPDAIMNRVMIISPLPVYAPEGF